MEGFVIGNEAERQFYLAAAGIRMWYARESLPGAAPSPDCAAARGVDSESVRAGSRPSPPLTKSHSRSPGPVRI